MGAVDGGCSALLAEIDAFYQGFGQPRALTDAMRSSVLLIPVTDDDRLLTSTVEGLDWICAFTGEGEYARYLAARGGHEGRAFRTLLGGRIVDELVPGLPNPTGVVVDIAGPSPMAFPPVEVRS
ncbi:SseB family protein [Rhodococcus sp. MTM3W5.2]|uniref:SseB family protein n=1 Tax=Rhodococcus sp. MTM3W5.2 TaxID=1805827 RepID=UPI00097BBD5A|nr:SseB family protein [Rhodococcus sp. MTM3W5.2]